MSRWLVVLALVCTCAAAHAQRKVQSTGFSYSVDKVPAWVVALPRSSVAPWSGLSALRILEVDTQVNLTGPVPVRFFRFKVVARESSAVSESAQIRMSFSPEYETLTVHEVSVTRAGKRVDRLAGTKFELLQREKELERSVYAGVVTSFAALQDVRVDDVVEYAYSIRGANPVFNGKFSGNFVLAWTTPVDALRIRIEHPAQAALHTKVFGIERAPTVAAKDGHSIVELALGGLAPVKLEDRSPAWAPLIPEMQVSQFSDWADVNQWAQTHYRTNGQLPPELIKVADDIRAASKSPEEMASRVLTFVQNEIRYFSVPVGVSSHRPSPPRETFSRRYGDCKDKTMLTVALLERLGIEARPALVSVWRRKQVADFVPMPHAFDHVIAEATINGRTYWLDSTQIYQGKSLAQRSVLPFGKALIVGREPPELVEVARDPDYREGLEVTERFAVHKYTGPIDLTVTTRARGSDAEYMRAVFASRPRELLTTEFDDSYKRRYPKLRRTGPFVIEDDLERNELSVTETFQVTDLFVYQDARVESRIYANFLAQPLVRPEVLSRSTPVALTYPAHRSQRFEFELPVETGFTGRPAIEIREPQFAFSYRSGQSGRTLYFQFDLETLRDHVAAGELPEFIARSRSVHQELERTLQFVAYNPREAEVLYRQAANAAQRDLAQLPAWTRRSLLAAMWARISTEQAIAWGLLEGDALATAWAEVALQRDVAGERDKGFEAVGEAFKIRPDSPAALRARGGLLLNSWKFDAALDDLKRIATQKPDDAKFALAIALYYLEKYPEALEALSGDARRSSGPDLTHRLLWTYLAARKAGVDAAKELSRNGHSASRSEWPAPALSYLLGEITEDKLMAAAKANSNEALQRLCEAWFFIGQNRLLSGDAAGARSAFQEVLKTDIRPYREYIFAGYELSRIKSPAP